MLKDAAESVEILISQYHYAKTELDDERLAGKIRSSIYKTLDTQFLKKTENKSK